MRDPRRNNAPGYRRQDITPERETQDIRPPARPYRESQVDEDRRDAQEEAESARNRKVESDRNARLDRARDAGE